MGAFGIGHWLVLLLIVVIVFGTGKLKDIGKDLGSAIRGFKEGLREGTEQAPAKTPEDPACVAHEAAPAHKGKVVEAHDEAKP